MTQNIITISFNTTDKMPQDKIDEMRQALYVELRILMSEIGLTPENVIVSALSQ